MEETKAEAARILEVIKTGDADKAAANLKFLADMGLISDVDRLQHIQIIISWSTICRRRTSAGSDDPVKVYQRQIRQRPRRTILCRDCR